MIYELQQKIRAVLKLRIAYVAASIILMVMSILNRNMMPDGIDYLFYMIIAVLSLKAMIGSREFSYPKYYIGILLTFLALILFNTFVSPYRPGIVYIALATVITILPFITFLLSYNICFTREEINSYFDDIIILAAVLGVLIYVENVVSDPPKIDSVLSSRVFMIGFYASLCVQSIVLSLARYHVTRKKIYIYAICFFIVTILLLNQLKAIAGAGTALVAYLIFMTRMRKIMKVLVLAAGVAAFAVWISLNGAMMIEKATKYSEYFADEESGQGIARVVLYVQAVEIAEDFFPLGTGQGTFGSIPVNIIYSDVYYDYDLADIWGLSLNHEVNFRMDTHWASLLGEAGVLGLIIYVILFVYPIAALRRFSGRGRGRSLEVRSYMFYTTCGMFVLMMESFFLALPNRFCFMLLYAGLNAVIVRNIGSTEAASEDDETQETIESQE